MKSIDKRLNQIVDRHIDTAKALLADETLSPESRAHVLTLMQAFTALHQEYSNLNDLIGQVLSTLKERD